MSSADGFSQAGGAGAGGADGGEGSPSKDCGANGKSGRAKKVSSTPRQSAAVLLQLKVIRKALERLMTERTQLDDVKMHLQTSSEDLEREIARVSRMRDIAQEASNFQHGRPHETVMEFLSLPSVMDEGGPQPGPSSAITDGAAALQKITNEFLFDELQPDDPAMGASGGDGYGGIDYVSHLINDLGIETFTHDFVEQVVRDIKVEDEDGEDAGDEDEDHY